MDDLSTITIAKTQNKVDESSTLRCTKISSNNNTMTQKGDIEPLPLALHVAAVEVGESAEVRIVLDGEDITCFR